MHEYSPMQVEGVAKRRRLRDGGVMQEVLKTAAEWARVRGCRPPHVLRKMELVDATGVTIKGLFSSQSHSEKDDGYVWRVRWQKTRDAVSSSPAVSRSVATSTGHAQPCRSRVSRSSRSRHHGHGLVITFGPNSYARTSLMPSGKPLVQANLPTIFWNLVTRSTPPPS
ncbi:hypothetical protein OG21DRAFT_333571 [Imleria badia]|nr:hypothetical protein OG21DRAFT_333571 [Imleria badia]